MISLAINITANHHIRLQLSTEGYTPTAFQSIYQTLHPALCPEHPTTTVSEYF
jgi:hypothetical protein